MRTLIFGTLLLTAMLSACSQPTPPQLSSTPSVTAPLAPPSTLQPLGRIEVTFNGVGTSAYATQVQDLSPGLASQALNDQASGLQLRFNSKGSFDVGSAGSGTRYLYATYDIRNAGVDGTPSTSARSNLTFIAVDAVTPATISGTAVRNLKRFDGSAADPALAQGITPMHGMISNGGIPMVNSTQADFMAFTESEASSLGALSGVQSVLPYGFVVRNQTTMTTRTLAANPATGQFDGQVTFAVRLPLQAIPANDPYTFSLVFEVVQDTQTRVTKTAQETLAAAQQRATALGATQVSAESVCSVRVAGAAGSPSATLTGLGVYTTPSGSLDPCFGTGGKVLTPVGPTTSNDIAYALVIQPDGKLVVAGTNTNVGGSTGNDFTLVRYNTDGTLDTSFGAGGKVITPVGPTTSSDTATSLALQADGKIVAAGPTTNVGGSTGQDVAVVRYNTDGTLDTSFGTGGKVITPVGPGTSPDSINALQIQPDGKIVGAGYTSNMGNNTGNDFAVVRYNTDGTLDTTFGTGGKVITPVGPTTSTDTATALQVQPDGKLVAVGNTSNAGGTTGQDIALVRYNADGTLDNTFGTGGKVIAAIGPGASSDGAQTLQLQKDGRTVISGYTSNSGGTTGQDIMVARFNANGTLDSNFGSGGKVITAVGPGMSTESANGLQIQPDGKVVVAGFTSNAGGSTGNDGMLVRYNPDGTLDSSFGTGGQVIVPVTPGADVIRALGRQADGKLVAAGYGPGATNGIDFAVIRVLP
ncbi:delta-60 repeat domain-containing protein (plasmid) [Deinococcus radiomollis]|uniref:hypothetical protein n=1 Tax=Deinococcus radiomollis TaxID=468916 RepID=UPI003891F781